MCIAAPAFAKNGGSHGSSGGNSHSGGGSQGNGGNGGNGGGNSQPGNGGGSQSNGGNGGGSNSTPVACSVNDISVAALACSGFYAGNILNGNDVAAQVAGLAAIHLEVRQRSQGARAFYRRHGFAEVGRVVGYYQGVEDAIRMVKRRTMARPLRLAR